MPSSANAHGTHELSVTLAEPKKAKAFYKRFGRFIAVNRKTYELVVCSSLIIGGQDCAGACVSEERRIYINLSASGPVEETLIHEIGHAEVHEGGYRQRTDWDPNLEEMLVELFGKAISHQYTLKVRGRRA
jgi:hypothetical protein